MAKKNLHPKVNEFKSFVKKHPQLIMEVRQGKTSWQDLFEEWAILGEDDPRWDEYKSDQRASTTKSTSKNNNDKNNQALLNNIMNSLKKMDMNQIQSYISQLHDALGAAQNLLTQFQSTTTEKQASNSNQEKERRPHPFSFFQD